MVTTSQTSPCGVRRQVSGEVVRSSDGAVVGTPWGAGYAPYNDVPVPGDYDGDSKTDIAVWRSIYRRLVCAPELGRRGRGQADGARATRL